MPNPHWYIILNRHSGPSGRAAELHAHLLDLLRTDLVESTTYETTSPGHAGEIGQHILSGDRSSAILVAIIGGDGTLHEVINGILPTLDVQNRTVKIVLLPSGTANALYHSLYPNDSEDAYRSVRSALSTSGQTVPLSVLSVTDSDGEHHFYSHVVTSTSLHAQLLDTASSPAMRTNFPGTERFKKAAELHLGTVYSANLKFYPRRNGAVQKWSLQSSRWEEVGDGEMEMEMKDGQFLYFVSGLVDRFEAKFRILPYSSPSTGRPADALDVLLVRTRGVGDKQKNAEKLFKVLMAAYEDGAHVQLTDEDGEQIIEYYRVGGYEWQPLSDEARIVCVDGTIFTLDRAKTLVCKLENQGSSLGEGILQVYV